MQKSILVTVFLVTLVFGVGIVYSRTTSRVALVSPIADVIAIIPPEASESAAVESSPSAIPTPNKMVAVETKTKPTAKPTSTPSPETAQTVNEYINQFASQYGVDPNVIRHIAICESGFRTNATNRIYAGLFQFNTTTWKNLRREIGEDQDPQLRFSAKASVQTAAFAISKGRGGMWPSCFPK